MKLWRAGGLVAAGLLVCMAALVASAGTGPVAPRGAVASAARTGPYLLPALTGTEWDRLPTSERLVALTFDAGANADGIPSILSTLNREQVPATFFLTGRWVETFRTETHQIAASPSNAIGNHTYDHPDNLTSMTDAQVQAEVSQADSWIADTTGRHTFPLFRFPFGARDSRTIGIVNSMGYGSIRWTVDTLGWQGISGGQSADSVVARVMGAAGPGEIVLMHVGSTPEPQRSTLDADALPTVIHQLRDAGYRFVNVAEFLRSYRVDAFARGVGGGIWHRWWDGQRWVGWEPLGGQTPPASGPAAASWGYDRLDVFVRGVDNQLWRTWWDGVEWVGWEQHGGILTSDPAVASRGYNRLDIFARGLDNGLWHKSWGEVGGWSEWEPLGGILTSAPAVSARGPDALDVFVRGIDNALWYRSWNGAGWSGWRSLGGVLTSAPAATVAGVDTNVVHVFARGQDSGLWRRSFSESSGQWAAWQPLGGILTSAPAADSRSRTVIDVFVRGQGDGLWQLWGNGAWWTGWGSLGGVLTSGPSSAA